MNYVNCLKAPHLIISSHLIPLPHAAIPSHACLQKARKFRQFFLDFSWVLWLQPFSNRLQSPTSKLNDSCCINCVTVFYAQCTVVSVDFVFRHYRRVFVVKPSSALSVKLCIHFLILLQLASQRFLSDWTSPPRKNTVSTFKKNHINNRYTTPNLYMMLGSLIDVYSFQVYSTLRPLSANGFPVFISPPAN